MLFQYIEYDFYVCLLISCFNEISIVLHSKYQNIKISKYQNIKISKYQNIKMFHLTFNSFSIDVLNCLLKLLICMKNKSNS
jgi:hypothetical protein